MTQEEKQLLLKDLCARLPYDTVVDVFGLGCVYLASIEWSGEIGVRDYYDSIYQIEDVKPYLRPMSSMTKEEREEIVKLHIDDRITSNIEICDANCVDFYNSHHLDYRGLISMGLALEAPEGMYN